VKTRLPLALLSLSLLLPAIAPAQVVTGFVPHEEDLISARFRSFGNTGGSELFVGVPDLGVGANRTEVNLTWAQGDTAFTFTLDRTADQLRLDVAGQQLVFENISAEIANRTSGSYTLFDLNLLQIDVAQRDAGSTVQLLDLTLNGDELGSFVPQEDGFFTWTVLNRCVSRQDVTILSGTLRLAGPFSNSQERSRVQITAGVRESDGLDCARTNPEPPGPGVFKDGFESQDLALNG
jgi:hypothetical protein